MASNSSIPIERIAGVEQPAPPAQRYTLDGPDDVEARIDQDQRQVAEAVRAVCDPDHFGALVLVGGYGQGAGGFERTAEGPQPYEGYDYRLIVRRSNAAWRAEVDERLGGLAREQSVRLGVPVQIVLWREERLPALPATLENAEIRWGHRIVDGDPQSMRAMPPLPFYGIAPGEMTRRLLERGLGLLENQQRLLRAEPFDAKANRHYFDNLFRAVLAAGDAKLAAARQYHPSYPERLERLHALDVRHHSKFMGLYELAYRQRFRPDYSAFAGEHPDDWHIRGVWVWLDNLRALEERRLGRPIGDWHAYCRARMPKGQSVGFGGPLRAVFMNARRLGAAALLRQPLRAARHPRERLIAALPLLLAERGSRIDRCIAQALAIPADASWQEASLALLENCNVLC
jgi:hypothetical protein